MATLNNVLSAKVSSKTKGRVSSVSYGNEASRPDAASHAQGCSTSFYPRCQFGVTIAVEEEWFAIQ